MKLTKGIGLVSASLSLTACSFLMGSNDVKVRPLENMSTLTAISHDPLYESAVTAIDTRDYARALDYLQQARARDPRSLKVLNALGVVYDKLGRFDLSARYYAQARVIAPESAIVARNMGYSNSLQGLMRPGRVASAVQAPISPGIAAIEKPAILASVSKPADLHAMLRENHTVLPVNNHAPVDKQQKSEVLATKEFVPLGQPLHKPVPLTKDVLPAVSKPAPSYSVLATNKPSLENKFAAAGAILQASNVSPFGEPAPTELSASKSPENKAVTENNALPANKVSQESKPPIANSVAPVASTLMIVKPLVEKTFVSQPILQAKALDPHEAVPAVKSVVDTAPHKVEAPTQSARAVIKPTPASIALAANKPSKATVSEMPPVQKIGPVNRLKPVKVVASVKKVVLAINPRSSGSSRESKVAPAVKVATPVRSVLTIGQYVRVFNASGKGIETVLSRLTSLGWSVRQVDGRVQQATTLYYPVKNTTVAKAMQRTLPFPLRLVPTPSPEMRLVVGRDYLSWKPSNARLMALWKKGVVIASLQGNTRERSSLK